MSKKTETLTCYQLWRRYHNANEQGTVLHRKWKHFVSELHDIERRISVVKDAIRNEYAELPAKDSGKVIPTDIQDKLRFLRSELVSLTDLRRETHFIITQYKKSCVEATTRANRYNMAYHQVHMIAISKMQETVKDRPEFIKNFDCTVTTNKDGGIEVVVVNNDGNINKFRF